MRRDFKEPARCRPDLVIGREEMFSAARDQLAEGGSVLLHGPAGIGKSTLLRALAAEYGETARTVLRCSATESESHLPFLALADLLGLVLDEVSERLPAAQRTALESALTGRGESSLQRDGLALRLAVLSALRALAADGPVLVVADDLQWLDPASAELLGFAARRLGDTQVQMVFAVRTEGQEYDRYLSASPPDTLAFRLSPLSRAQVSGLLDHRGYAGLPRSTVREIHRTSGGNPLFALELGRALAENPTPPRPGEPLPVPTSLRALVLSRLDMLPAEARRTLLVASVGRPSHGRPAPDGRPGERGGGDRPGGRTRPAGNGTRGPRRTVRASADLGRAVRGGARAGAAGRARGAVDGGLRPHRARPASRPGHHRHRPGGRRPPRRGRDPGPRPGAPSVAASLGLLAARHTPATACRARTSAGCRPPRTRSPPGSWTSPGTSRARC